MRSAKNDPLRSQSTTPKQDILLTPANGMMAMKLMMKSAAAPQPAKWLMKLNGTAIRRRLTHDERRDLNDWSIVGGCPDLYFIGEEGETFGEGGL